MEDEKKGWETVQVQSFFFNPLFGIWTAEKKLSKKEDEDSGEE